jgi:hypothetical protein
LARMGVPARLVSQSGRIYAIGAWPADPRRTQIPSPPDPACAQHSIQPHPIRAPAHI